MGIESTILADAVVCMEAQRLVRKVCKFCAEEVEVSSEELAKLGIISPPVKILKGKGCNRCNGTGYKGRTVVEEVIPVDEFIREAILNSYTRDKFMEHLYSQGFRPMKVIGVEKVLKGITTFEELARVVDVSGVKIVNGKPTVSDAIIESRKTVEDQQKKTAPEETSVFTHIEVKPPITKDETTQKHPPPSGAFTVLITDDSPTIRAMLKPIFEMEGFRVLEATNGLEAIETLKKEPVHLIVLDLVMPELDGFETLKRIKNHPFWKNIPVVMLTTKGELENELKGFDLGVDEFMPKPFLPERLLARVRALVRRYYG